MDASLLDRGIGFTDVAKRPSNAASDLPRSEFAAGASLLIEKLEHFQPLVACFNGISAYAHCFGPGAAPGPRPELIGRTQIYVLPSTSRRNAHYQKNDILHWFQGLKNSSNRYGSSPLTRTPKDSHPTPATTRTFVAIEVPVKVKDLIASHVERLKNLVSRGIAWVDPKTCHLTLAFLGNVPNDRLPTLPRLLDAVAADSPPLRLKTGLLGAFPNPHRPRVLWLGLEGDTQLLAVTQRRLQDALETDGLPREQRAFKPHITLGRARGKGLIHLPETALNGQVKDALAFEILDIVLMSSILTPSGPIHTLLHRALLSAQFQIP